MAYILGTFFLWDIIERRLARKYAQRCRPFPLPDSPVYQAKDVSIVLPCVDPPDAFLRCLESWLKNKPKEVIIVTIPKYAYAIQELAGCIKGVTGKINVLTIDQADLREQQSCGFRAACGAVIVAVDDDTFATTDETLIHLLAPFQDPWVGGVGNCYVPDLPMSRRKPNRCTSWEAIATRNLGASDEAQKVRFGADGGVFCLPGRCQTIRAEILKDPAFLESFVNETFRGKRITTGNDNFITRWIVDHGWKVVIQTSAAATVANAPARDSRMLWQLLRWLRSTWVSFLTILGSEPGFWALRRKHPYMARKILEKLLRPVLSAVCFGVWVRTLFTNLPVAFMFAAWNAYLYAASYHAFVLKYPWFHRHIWALFLMDIGGTLLVDIYALLTMDHDAWLTRDLGG